VSGLATALTMSAVNDANLVGVSETFQRIRRQWRHASSHYSAPVTRKSIGELFAELAATWNEETATSSSPVDMIMNRSYQRIIGLGQPVVPYLLQALAAQPDHWFWALSSITGADPVPAGAAGNIAAMRAAWLRWGKEQGLVD